MASLSSSSWMPASCLDCRAAAGGAGTTVDITHVLPGK
jgi:hypothetical protein